MPQDVFPAVEDPFALLGVEVVNEIRGVVLVAALVPTAGTGLGPNPTIHPIPNNSPDPKRCHHSETPNPPVPWIPNTVLPIPNATPPIPNPITIVRPRWEFPSSPDPKALFPPSPIKLTKLAPDLLIKTKIC